MARRKTSNTKWIASILFGLFVIVLIIIFTQEKSAKKNTKQIIIAMSQEPDTLDPLFMEMAAAWEMYWLYYEDMIEFDLDWNLIPRIVTEIPSLENGGVEMLPDNKVRVTWHLKKGLKWSDGVALTPQDFIQYHEMKLDNRLPVITRDLDQRIEKMEAPDDTTLIVTWKEPYAYAAISGHGAIPKHIVQPLYEKNPEKYHESEFNSTPVGNGPFKLKEWVAGSHLIFEPNPYWTGKKPHFESIIYKIIPNTNSMESNLLSGTVDAISPLGLTLDQALDFERRHSDKFKFHYRPALVWEHIDFNLDNPILQDKRVRQALLYAANRQMMNDVLFQGKQKVAHSWLPEKHYGYHSNIREYAYDLEKAEKLLEEAGWIKSPSGIRVNNRGDTLTLTIMTTADNKTREQVEQILQADWKKIGVDLQIENQPAKVFFGDTMKKRKFKHLAMYAWINSPLSDCESGWTSKNIPSEKNNWQGQNNPGWVNPTSDELCSTIPVTLSEAKRKAMLQKQQEIWAEELPSLPLFFRTDASITHKDLQNWALTGNLQPVTWNAEEWTFAH